MEFIITPHKAQEKLAEHTKTKRLAMGLTQRGLAYRSGVKLATLRKFEQKGVISLESFLKLLMVLGALERVVEAVRPEQVKFSSIDEVLEETGKKMPQRGWRT